MIDNSMAPVAVHGGFLATWSGGHGIPTLMLHGGPGMYDYTEPLADEIGEVCAWVRYQQRGLDPTTVRGPYTVDSNVSDAVAVMDSYEMARAVIVGHSWGGLLAMHVAARHPDRIAALLLVDPAPADPMPALIAMVQELRRRIPDAEHERLAALDAQSEIGFAVPADSEAAMRLFWRAYFGDPTTAPPPPDELRMCVEAAKEGFAAATEAQAVAFLAKALPFVGAPVTMLIGAASPLPRREHDATAALFQDVRVEVVAGAGHWPHLEQPGSVGTAMQRLLSRTSAA